MWREVTRDLEGYQPRHICAVSNLGSDENWTGQNTWPRPTLFAYGLFAWRIRTTPMPIGGSL